MINRVHSVASLVLVLSGLLPWCRLSMGNIMIAYDLHGANVCVDRNVPDSCRRVQWHQLDRLDSVVETQLTVGMSDVVAALNLDAHERHVRMQPLRAKISRYANPTLIVMPDVGILTVLLGVCLALIPLWSHQQVEQRALLVLLLSVLLMATYDMTGIASQPAEGFILAFVSFFTIVTTCIVNNKQ